MGVVWACVHGLYLLKMCFFESGCTLVRLLILVFNIYVGLVCSSRICYDSVLETILYPSLVHASDLARVNDFQPESKPQLRSVVYLPGGYTCILSYSLLLMLIGRKYILALLGPFFKLTASM